MSPSGIEPATFRFVAQHLNYCVTAVPQLYICIYVKYPIFFSDLNQIFIFSTDLRKKKTKTPSTGGPVVPCGQINGRTGMTKLIVVFRSLANAPKMAVLRVNEIFVCSCRHQQEKCVEGVQYKDPDDIVVTAKDDRTSNTKLRRLYREVNHSAHFANAASMK